jgi:hypothetical protein
MLLESKTYTKQRYKLLPINAYKINNSVTLDKYTTHCNLDASTNNKQAAIYKLVAG